MFAFEFITARNLELASGFGPPSGHYDVFSILKMLWPSLTNVSFSAFSEFKRSSHF
jgi:hypothetical protein